MENSAPKQRQNSDEEPIKAAGDYQTQLDDQAEGIGSRDAHFLQKSLVDSYLNGKDTGSASREFLERQQENKSFLEREGGISTFTNEQISSVFERLHDAGRFGDLSFDDPVTACLLPLLETLGWHGSSRDLAEALPHLEESLSLKDLRNTMAHLGFGSREYNGAVEDLDNRVLPALYILDDGRAWIIRETNGQLARVYDGGQKKEKAVVLKKQTGRVVLFVDVGQSELKTDSENQWLTEIFRRLKPIVAKLFAITAVINILSLTVSLVVIAVYDLVIPSKAFDTLIFLVGGVFIALCVEFALRIVKSSIIGFIGGRVEYIVSTASFAKILSLPLDMVENSSLGQQTSRLKEFESIRDLFVGPFMTIGLELPFMLLFIGVIAFFGGPIALVPVVVLGLYGILAFFFVAQLRRKMSQSAYHRNLRLNFLLEACHNRATIKQFSGEATWIEKYRHMSADASFAHFKTHKISGLMQVYSQAIVTLAGAFTMAIGAYLVLEEQMTTGALIACMILTWRVLSPMQSLFLVFTRFENIRQSIRQMNQLMASKSEPSKETNFSVSRKLSGSVEFERVQFRYRGGQDVALMGLSMKVEPGELMSIMGPSGAGKTTLLKMILGLYRAPSGRIYVDGIDIRQLNPREIRHNIGYVPQSPQYFDDTIAQNIRLTNPTATDEDIRRVCKEFGILEAIEALPNGFETRMSQNSTDSVSTGLRQALTVASAMMRNPSVLLLDEPAHRMDASTDERFAEILTKLRGKVTVIMTSHRPSHIRLADKLMVMERGVVLGIGNPDDMLSRISNKPLPQSSAPKKQLHEHPNLKR